MVPTGLERESGGCSGGRTLSRARPLCCSCVGDGTAGMASFGVPGRPVFLLAPRDLLRDRLRGILVTGYQVVRDASVCMSECPGGWGRTRRGSSSRPRAADKDMMGMNLVDTQVAAD